MEVFVWKSVRIALTWSTCCWCWWMLTARWSRVTCSLRWSSRRWRFARRERTWKVQRLLLLCWNYGRWNSGEGWIFITLQWRGNGIRKVKASRILTLSALGGAGPSIAWGGVNLTHSQEIIKGVDWDTILLFRVWTYINIEITCKNSEPNFENWVRFWDLNFLRNWDFVRLDSRKSP